LQPVLGDAALEHFGALLALPAADNLAVAIRRDQVATERVLAGAGDRGAADGVRLLEVKRLDLRRHMVNEDGLSELLAERRLVRRAEVLAPGDADSLLLQHLYRLIVRDAWKGPADRLELGKIALEDLELGRAARKHRLHDVLH